MKSKNKFQINDTYKFPSRIGRQYKPIQSVKDWNNKEQKSMKF